MADEELPSAEAVAVAEDGPEKEPAAEASPGRAMFRALVALATVAVIAAVGIAIVAAGLARDLHRERDDRRAAESVASRFASRLLTYDYNALDATKASVLRLSTGRFHSEYEQAFSGLNQLITATKGRSSAVVKDVFSSEIEGSTATAVVVLDQSVTGVSGTQRRLDAWIEASLVKAGSRWLVDDVTNLNFGQTQAASDAATTTTTTAPAPPG